MSGIEIVGLVLGVLPIILSAIEHRHGLTGPFRRWHSYPDELRRFQSRMSVIKTMLQMELETLLIPLLGISLTKKMLVSNHHEGWSNPDLNRMISDYLGDKYRSFCLLVESVKEDLEDLESEYRSFQYVDSGAGQVETSRASSWPSKISQRAKFSTSERIMNAKLQSLYDNIKKLHHFLDLAKELYLAKEFEPSRQKLPHLVKFSSETELDAKIAVARYAVAGLYEALMEACNHPEHRVYFGLETCYTNMFEKNLDNSFGFEIALHHVDSKSATDEALLWVSVGSCLSQNDRVATAAYQDEGAETFTSQNSRGKKRSSDTEPPTPNKRTRIRQNYDPALKENSQAHNARDRNSNAVLEGRLRSSSLSECKSFCQTVRRSSMQNNTEPIYLGYLRTPNDHNHSSSPKNLPNPGFPPLEHQIVLPPIRPPTSPQVSLTSLISTLADCTSMNGLFPHEILHLAKLLASAVLNFHDTPLLKECWTTEDIIFFDVEKILNSQQPQLSGSLLAIFSGVFPNSPTHIPGSRRIRNPYIFTLGVILMEVAHQAPLQRLLNKSNSACGERSTEEIFDDADRLSRTMNTSLGAQFTRLVQKCINCDFGNGEDLRLPELQVAFHRDVICKLDELEMTQRAIMAL